MALKTSERPKKKVREELISLETRRTIKSWDKTFSECLSHWELWGAVVAESGRRGRMSEKTQQEQVIALWGFLGCEKLSQRLRK